jgi:hypothetical protein
MDKQCRQSDMLQSGLLGAEDNFQTGSQDVACIQSEVYFKVLAPRYPPAPNGEGAGGRKYTEQLFAEGSQVSTVKIAQAALNQQAKINEPLPNFRYHRNATAMTPGARYVVGGKQGIGMGASFDAVSGLSSTPHAGCRLIRSRRELPPATWMELL